MLFNIEDIIHFFRVDNDLYISGEVDEYNDYLFSIQRAENDKFIPFIFSDALNPLDKEAVSSLIGFFKGDVYFPLEKDKVGDTFFYSCYYNSDIGHSERDIANLLYYGSPKPDLIIKISEDGYIHSAAFESEEIYDILLNHYDIDQSEIDCQEKMTRADEYYDSYKYGEY